MYDEIKHLKISDLDVQRLNAWIEIEINELANDFGQNVNDDMIMHIGKRLRDKLTTAYRSWHVGTVHASFQTGLTGGYGAFRKVTVQSLFHFLKMSQNQMAAHKAMSAEEESARNRRQEYTTDDPVTDFLMWATKNRICLTFADPNHDPLTTRRVSVKIEALAREYQDAKEMEMLNPFRDRLRDRSLSYAEEVSN